MNPKVWLAGTLFVLRWVAMLVLFGYGIFAQQSWAIAAGGVIAAFGLIYSSVAFARRVKRSGKKS